MAATVTLLAYHRVAPPGNLDLADSLIDAYPADFEAQMRFLAAHYTVVSGWDLVRALRGRYRLPPRALVLTFDDGYTCFRDRALPVLQRLGLPATLFIPTAFPGGSGGRFWWDAIYSGLMRTAQTAIEVPGVGRCPLDSRAARYAAFTQLAARVERLPEAAAARLVDQVVAHCAVPSRRGPYVLDWAELAELAAAGVAIGPHTRRHIILAQATPARVREEVAGAWADLRLRLPHPLPIFCYPCGKPHAISPDAVLAVRDAGLAGACTMIPGLNVVGRTDPYRLHRVGLEAGESLQKFALKLTVVARVYWRLKAAVRPRPARQS